MQVDVAYGSGYEYTVIDDLNEKKLNIQEKVKKAKPGLTMLEQIEALAAEAREKGGAQVRLCTSPPPSMQGSVGEWPGIPFVSVHLIVGTRGQRGPLRALRC